MGKPVQIHRSKQPNRPHFVKEWVEKRGFTTQTLIAELDVDKSVVSRWFHGTTPGLEWQEALAALFHIEREDLFRHPDEHWLSRKLRQHTQEERERMIRMIEAAFPDPKTGTDG